MKIKNLKIRTKDESIKLSDINAINFGEIYQDRRDLIPTAERLYVSSKRGDFNFLLDEIISIEFQLDGSKRKIRLSSYVLSEEEE